MKWFWWVIVLVVGKIRSAARSSESGGDRGSSPADSGPADSDRAGSPDASSDAVGSAEIPNSVLDSGYDPRLATQVMGMTPEPSSEAPVPGAAGEGGDPGSPTDPDKKPAPSDAPDDATAGATDAGEEIDRRSQH